MKILLKVQIAVILLITSCGGNDVQERSRRNFFINPVTGDNSNPGTTADSAWRDLSQLLTAEPGPGDSILLAAGAIHKGTLYLDSVRGTGANPVIITSYGGGKAVIDSGDTTAVYASHCSFLSVSNLELRGSGRLEGSRTNGIELVGCESCTIDSLIAHSFLYSGIRITGGSNIRITRCRCHDNGFCGINADSGEKEYGADGSAYKTMRNIYIGYCIADNNPGCPAITDNHSGNGILLGGVTGGLIEHCEAMNNGWDMPREGNGPVGIWAYMSDSITIQYCYAHHNRTSEKGKDGGGFDFDGGVRYSVMQYNLSAFNEGAGYGIFQYGGATSWNDNIMRYNVSFNDGSKNGNCGILVWCDPAGGPMHSFHASCNTIINKFAYAVAFEPGAYADFLFENNVFILPPGSGRQPGGEGSLAEFRRNSYLDLGSGVSLDGFSGVLIPE